jgi:replicative DNA helicase
LLLLLLRDRSLLSRVAGQVEPDNFRTPEYREIYEALIGAAEEALPGEDVAGDDLSWAEGLPPALYERVREILADPEELTNPLAVLEDATARLRARALEQRLDDLMTEVIVADTSAAVELATEIKKLRQELAALGSRLPGRGFLRGE